MAGWNADTAAGPLGAEAVTLVEGSSFCISMANGDIHPEHPHGLFVLDTRVLSGYRLSVNGQPLDPLAAEIKESYRALFVGRLGRLDGYADSLLIVERLRELRAGLQEQITVWNYGLEPAKCVVSLTSPLVKDGFTTNNQLPVSGTRTDHSGISQLLAVAPLAEPAARRSPETAIATPGRRRSSPGGG